MSRKFTYKTLAFKKYFCLPASGLSFGTRDLLVIAQRLSAAHGVLVPSPGVRPTRDWVGPILALDSYPLDHQGSS